MQVRISLATGALILFAVQGSGGASLPSDRPMQAARVQAVLDHHADDYLGDPCRAGISIAALIGGRTYYANRGVADRGTRTPPTSNSVYELASVTKTFAGALAARAVIDGRMTLDGDFRRHLPRSYPNLSKMGSPITLRTLATHTAGLQRDLPDSDPLFAKLDHDRIGAQLAELNKGYGRTRSLHDLHFVKLRSVPGATFAYSNLGMRVIGYGLETIYRQPMAQIIQRDLLTPLGMASTRFQPDASMRRRLVTPYGRSGKIEPLHDGSAGLAYGLYSTPRDMARYLAWHLNDGDLVVARSHALLRGTARDGQGLIWNIGDDHGRRLLWHGGGSFGETSQMVLFPDQRQGYVLLANDACEGSEAAMKQLAISLAAALREHGRR